jgi:tetratricopeptide (TPR) repeat protein
MFRPALAATLALLTLMAGAPAPAGAETAAEAVARAAAAFAAEDWEGAAAAFDAAIELDPEAGRAWFGLGQARRQQGRLADAEAALIEAQKLGFAVPQCRYRLAELRALAGDTDGALAWLEGAVAAGFQDLDALDGDPDLASLRGSERFGALRDGAERLAFPCRHDPRYRELDFWLGDWDVLDQAGRRVGVNSVQPLLEGCAILENWTSVAGTSGKSLNFLDPETGRWRQHWVDQGGRVIDMEGGWADGAMRVEGRIVGPDGEAQPMRMSLEPMADGSVRQHIESSADGGETWSTWFLGRYVRAGGEGGESP